MPRAAAVLAIIYFLSKVLGFGAPLPPHLLRSLQAPRAPSFRAFAVSVRNSERASLPRHDRGIASTSFAQLSSKETHSDKHIPRFRLSRSGQHLIPLSMSTAMNEGMGESKMRGTSAGAECAGLDRSKFDNTLELVAIRLPAKLCTSFMNALKPILFSRARMKRIFNVEDDQEKRILLLHPDVKLDHFKNGGGNVTKEHIDFITANGGEAIPFGLKLGYDNMLVDEVLKAILPEGSEVPSSYEQAGHIAHVNIRDDYLAYKNVIGQVILDKNYPQIRTVVNKVGEISNEFRTFPMEVIAGEHNLEVTLRETGANFSFNFAEVYWNSRLQMEHKRVVDFIRKEHAAAAAQHGGGGGGGAGEQGRGGGDVVVADMMAGVGPFAVPLALPAPSGHKKGKGQGQGQGQGKGKDKDGSGGGTGGAKLPPIRVFANDLNPRSYAALVNNAKANKISYTSLGHIPDVMHDGSSSSSDEDRQNWSQNRDGGDGASFRLYNACGRTFLRHLAAREGIIPTEVLMNLPASATDFLDALRGIGTLYMGYYRLNNSSGGGDGDKDKDEEKEKDRIATVLPRVHVYGFSTAADPVLDMAERACGVMQCNVGDLGARDMTKNVATRTIIGTGAGAGATTTWSGHNVRDVAPKKLMICLSFYVPPEVAFAPVDTVRQTLGTKSTELELEPEPEPDAKRMRTSSSTSR